MEQEEANEAAWAFAQLSLEAPHQWQRSEAHDDALVAIYSQVLSNDTFYGFKLGEKRF